MAPNLAPRAAGQSCAAETPASAAAHNIARNIRREAQLDRHPNVGSENADLITFRWVSKLGPPEYLLLQPRSSTANHRSCSAGLGRSTPFQVASRGRLGVETRTVDQCKRAGTRLAGLPISDGRAAQLTMLVLEDPHGWPGHRRTGPDRLPSGNANLGSRLEHGLCRSSL